MKKIILIILILILNFGIVGADDTIKNGLLVQPDIIVGGLNETDNGNFNALDSIFKYAKDSISGLLLIVVLGTFIFIGARLFIARGNPEESKKAMMHFVYAVVGIFLISFAWAAVKLVSGISI